MIPDVLPHFVFSHSCLFTPPPQCCLLSGSASFPCREISAGVGREGRKSCLLAVTSHRCYWPRSLGIPWPSSLCISLISRVFLHFQHLSSSQDHHLLLCRPSSCLLESAKVQFRTLTRIYPIICCVSVFKI